MAYLEHGTKPFHMAVLALFAGGFNTLAILWALQPLLPELAKEFQLSPSVSSLGLSSTTIALAFCMLIAGSLSEVFGRKRVMSTSLIASSILCILTALSPNFQLLIFFRILQGMVLAGLPAVAMAYIGEEIDPNHVGFAMGLYVSGNSAGGMVGRILCGILTEFYNWHIALAASGLIGLLLSLFFCLELPESRHFQARSFSIKFLAVSLLSQFKTPGLAYIFGIGFLLMGGFAAMYNYIGFQLMSPPYSLSQTMVSFIFVVYIVGTFSSTWMGMLSDRYGKKKVLLLSLIIFLAGAILTSHTNLWIKIIGVAIFTYGYFASHSVASGWVGRISTHDKAQASALYLFSYYVGSSIGGTSGGVFYSAFGWNGVVLMIVILAIISILLSILLSRLLSNKRQVSSQNEGD